MVFEELSCAKFVGITLKSNAFVMLTEANIIECYGEVFIVGKQISIDHIGDSGGLIILNFKDCMKIEETSEARKNFINEIGRRKGQTIDLETVLHLRRLVDQGQQAGVIAKPPQAPNLEKTNEVAKSRKQPASAADTLDAPTTPIPPQVIPVDPPQRSEKRQDDGDYKDDTVVEIPPPQ